MEEKKIALVCNEEFADYLNESVKVCNDFFDGIYGGVVSVTKEKVSFNNGNIVEFIITDDVLNVDFKDYFMVFVNTDYDRAIIKHIKATCQFILLI